jgi:hypothetical protein
VSFLQFLLSREKDIDVFTAGRDWHSVRPTIELIPEGFTLARRKRSRDWEQVPQQPYRQQQE